MISAAQPTPTRQATGSNPAPSTLRGKILFLADADHNGQPEAYAINANGKQLTRLVGLTRYSQANEREAYSLDRRFHAFSQKEMNGDHNPQIFYNDKLYSSVSQATFLGGITAWSPAWSPTHEAIAFVVTYAHNDEIWLAQRNVDNQWVTTPLTQNKWDRDRHPSWSPDGTQIVFGSTRGDGQQRLWIMAANGDQPHQVADLPFAAWDPVWVK
jgi:TolB protein